MIKYLLLCVFSAFFLIQPVNAEVDAEGHCTEDADCPGTYCQSDPEALTTFADKYCAIKKKENGETCEKNIQCQSGKCFSSGMKNLCALPCTNDADCPGTYCISLNPSNTYCAIKKLENDETCKEDNQCKSGKCLFLGTDPNLGTKIYKCASPAPSAPIKNWAPIAPTIEIKIPTLQPFTTQGLEQPDEYGNIYIPFIGQYIVGIYKWLLLVAGIIATVMIILGGFQYLTSGGNATMAGQGKERIGAAIFGLILLLGSYLLLYLLNPGLVEFRSLKIKVIERTPIESMVFGDHSPAIGSSKALDATDYDATFQAFASCSGIDWHFYKVVAFKESGLNNTILGSTYKGNQYTGLFQVYPPYCKNALGKVKWDSYCDSPGLTNPGVNNAYAALLSDANIAKVENKCPNAQIADKFAMLYVGHNCGPGALSSLLQKGCDFNQWLAAPPDNCKKGKMDLAKNIGGIIMGLGVTNFKTTPDLTKCPFNSGMPLL